MPEYIKYFNNHSNYEQYMGGDVVFPNVSFCKEEKDIHFNPKTRANGHAYVDLGLPSGTLWATMNIGATGETDGGLFFAWGDTQGYTKDEVTGGTKNFNWSSYPHADGAYNKLTKYCPSSATTYWGGSGQPDNEDILSIEDDAARVNWGGEWEIPSISSINELSANTTCTWDSQRVGNLFTSNINGNSIFIPAVGTCISNTVLYEGDLSACWTTELYTTNPRQAWFSQNTSSGCALNNNYERAQGLTIRPVLPMIIPIIPDIPAFA